MKLPNLEPADDDLDFDLDVAEETGWRWLYTPREGESGTACTACTLRAQFSRRVLRRVERLEASGAFHAVDALEVNGSLWTGFDDFETVTHEIAVDLGAAAAAGVDVELPFAVDGSFASEEIRDVAGVLRGRLVRERAMVFGRLIARVRRFDDSDVMEVNIAADLVAGAALVGIEVEREARAPLPAARQAPAPVFPSNMLHQHALAACAGTPKRALVIGAGNIFCGDSAFGVEVARLLMRETWDANVEVAELGARGLHLAYRLLDPPDLIVVVDVCARGGPPGTLYVLDVADDVDDIGEAESSRPRDGVVAQRRLLPWGTILGPAGAAISVVNSMRGFCGGEVPPVIIVGCEPALVQEGTALSSSVAAALSPAVSLVKSVVARHTAAAATERALSGAAVAG